MIFPHTDFKGHVGARVHLGVTGSVAAYKAVDIMRRLQYADVTVGATLTAAAQKFIRPLQFRSLANAPVYDALFSRNQGEYAHLEPAQNAAVYLVAPATANTLAKHAHGMGDDLLSTQLLAFTGPIIHAPAMNPRIWSSPAVQRNISILRELDCTIVEPEEGCLACGETGSGRLAAIEEIFLIALRRLIPQDFSGCHALVNLGPTHEPIDPVRFIGNPSSGVMGASFALAAWLRGAEVDVVSGPVANLWLPRFIRPFKVQTAKQMHSACLDLRQKANLICLTAAVSDYRPAECSPAKIKKSAHSAGMTLVLHPNPDILADIGHDKRPDQILIGFAAETSGVRQESKRKLETKNLDMIVANRVDQPGSGFQSSTNQVMVRDRTGRIETWPILSKPEISMRLLDWTSSLLRP